MDKSLNKTADSAHTGKYASSIKPSPRADKAVRPRHAFYLRLTHCV